MKCHDFLQHHCQSCELLSLDYSSSIRTKEEFLAKLFPLHLDKVKTSVTCPNSHTEETRNKAKLSVALVNSEIQFGFYDSGIQFKKLENCPLQANPINACLPLLKKLLAEYKIIPYEIKSKTGELKYVLITHSKSTDELLLRFVIRSKESLDRLKKMANELQLQSKKVKVVTANIQNVHQAILEGEEEIVLTDSDFITHHFGSVALFQGARSFFQTNTDMAISLYEQFQKELSVREVNSLLDLYCGVGAFSFYATKFCKKVVGIEISKEAIEYAQKNQTFGIEFHALDVEKYLTQPTEHFDAIIVNPPRRGLNDQIISQLIKISPEYIFYSSCSAETLERDWQILKNNYQIDSLQLFDMFPYTMHFETLVVLSRKKD
jgi:23S rRNA (uracil747-C5)-methyltransferase